MRIAHKGGEIIRNSRILMAGAAILAALGIAACGSSPTKAATSSAGTASPTSAGPASAGAPSAVSLPANIRSAGVITVGSELTVPPMIFFESNGTTMSGINYDLAQAMSSYLGVAIKFKQYAFPGLQPALEAGKIDAIFDAINDTKQREQQFNFIDYVSAGNALLLQAGNPNSIQSLSDMCGHTIATVSGSVQIALVQTASTTCTAKGAKPITISQYQSAATARLQVQTGKVTAFIGNAPVLLYLAKTAGNGKTFDAIAIQGQPSYYGIAVAKSDTTLLNALLAAVNHTIADGTYQQVLAKYGLSSIGLPKAVVNAAAS